MTKIGTTAKVVLESEERDMKTKTTIHLSILCLIIMSITFIISAEANIGNDGTINRAWHFSYDTNGKPAKGEFDVDGDGSINKVWYYTYFIYTENNPLRSLIGIIMAR